MPDLPKCKEWDTTTCAECKKEKCSSTKLKAMENIVRECLMWRNVWGWVPPEVKYYVARVGQEVGLTMRNYKRYLGTLVDSHWDLVSLEVGTVDKVYDAVRDKTFYEKKIVVIQTSGIVDMQWIKERKAWEDFEAERIAEKEQEEKKEKETEDT
jgi:hypothetical protein